MAGAALGPTGWLAPPRVRKRASKRVRSRSRLRHLRGVHLGWLGLCPLRQPFRIRQKPRHCWKAKESALAAEKQRVQYEIANSTGATREPWKYKLGLWRLKKEQVEASAKPELPKRTHSPLLRQLHRIRPRLRQNTRCCRRSGKLNRAPWSRRNRGSNTRSRIRPERLESNGNIS